MVAGLALISQPASAAPQPLSLAMVEEGGQLKLAAAAEPFIMENPTTLGGTIDDETGVISDVSFSTPEINFQQEASGLPVDITAKFSQPSLGTGNADGLGNVELRVAIKLDIHVDVGGGAIVTDCVSSPVNLRLVSTAPYDAATQRVTLADPNFTIPPVANDGICNSLVSGPINEQLAGPGNSIQLLVEGPIALPPPPGDPSETTLTSAASSTSLGAPATFTATVSPSDATGNVTFFNGSTPMGTVPLEADATATFTTSSLAVGTHQITARYAGNVDYGSSVSAALTHTVTATPSVTADVPLLMIAGGDPAEFTMTVSNPSSGAALSNLRVDMAFGALTGLGADGLTVEWLDGDTWTELPTPGTAPPRNVQFDGPPGFALAPGASRSVQVRLTAAETARPGKLPVTLKVVSVDPETEAIVETFGQLTGETWIVDAERRDTTAEVQTVEGLMLGGVTPRVGDSLRVQTRVVRSGTGVLPNLSGTAELFIDGTSVATMDVGPTGSASFELVAGPDSPLNNLAPGQHQAVVRYRGDNVWNASVSPAFDFTLAPWTGARYTCTLDLLGLLTQSFAARMDVQAAVPASALPGTTVDLERMGVTVWTQGSPGMFSSIGTSALTAQTLQLTGGATGTFDTFAESTQPAGEIEGYSKMTGAEGSVVIEGEPGDVIDIDLMGFSMNVEFLPGINIPFPCVANEGGERVASITVAGTTLSTTATSPVTAGTAVPLTASVFPATSQGVVEFLADGESVGLAVVSDGQATVDVASLGVGTHSITARYLGDLNNPASESEPIEVTVRDAIECAAQAQPGHPATVRATYLLLLGRCGDQAGFDYWVGKLGSGTSVESFASSIATTLEAHKRSVVDAYDLVLDRAPSAADRDFWGRRLQGAGRYDKLVGDLAASDEFYAHAGRTPTGWVTLAYERILQRTPDAGGLAYWVGRLNKGESRSSVAAAMLRLKEPTGTLVKEAYRAILHREPTAAELNREVPRFQADGSRAGIYARVIGTPEFVDNAQAYPNP